MRFQWKISNFCKNFSVALQIDVQKSLDLLCGASKSKPLCHNSFCWCSSPIVVLSLFQCGKKVKSCFIDKIAKIEVFDFNFLSRIIECFAVV